MAGKVLDTSAVAAWTEGWVSIQAWVGVARTRGLTLLVPALARLEILSLRPGAAELVGQLTAHPHVLVVELTDRDRSAIESLLSATGTCDVLAAWVIQTCEQRGWAALTADPVGCAIWIPAWKPTCSDLRLAGFHDPRRCRGVAGVYATVVGFVSSSTQCREVWLVLDLGLRLPAKKQRSFAFVQAGGGVSADSRNSRVGKECVTKCH